MHGYCLIPGCGNRIQQEHDFGVCDTCGLRIARRYRAQLSVEQRAKAEEHRQRRIQAHRDRHARDRIPELWAAHEQPSDTTFVYYVRIGDHIKIGYTTRVLGRLRALRVPVPDLLALEPGGPQTERSRHQQFAHLRITKRWENFRPEPDLLDHINDLTEAHGLPAWLTPPPRRGRNGPVEVRHRDARS